MFYQCSENKGADQLQCFLMTQLMCSRRQAVLGMSEKGIERKLRKMSESEDEFVVKQIVKTKVIIDPCCE